MNELSAAAQSIVKDPSTFSDYSLQAMAILRDSSQFQWYIIPVLLLVIYAYTIQMNKKNYGAVLAGLAFWGMDWFNEIWNALVFYFTQFAPVWGAPGNETSFLLLAGLNIEITFMFLMMGLASTFLLPEDKHAKILGINNRWFIGGFMAIFCVIVECLLNLCGALTWEYSFWRVGCPWLIWLIGYLPFFMTAYWVYDMETTKKQVTAVSCILGFDVLCLVIFGGILGWM